MKKNISPFIVCLFFFMLPVCLRLHAQRAEKIPSCFFFRFYTQIQYFDYKEQHGTFDIKFPYVLRGENGSSSQHTFASTKFDLTGTGKFSYTFPGLEIGYGRFSVDANMNFITGPVWGWTDNFYFGLNYRLPSPLFFIPREKIQSAAVIPDAPTEYNAWRVSVHLGILYYHPLYELGEIDAGNDHFYAAGQILPERDTAVASPGNVKIYLQQNTISFTPALEFAYHPENFPVDFGLRISPLIMLSQEGGLRFRYRNRSQMKHAPGGYNLHYIPLDTYGIDANYNGAPVTATPFRLEGFMITLRVGLRMDYD